MPSLTVLAVKHNVSSFKLYTPKNWHRRPEMKIYCIYTDICHASLLPLAVSEVDDDLGHDQCTFELYFFWDPLNSS